MSEQKQYSQTELKKLLTPQQYSCTQEEGTEKPFANAFWNNKEDGIYIDLISKKPLFSSLDKYDSGSGWPSFTKPIEDQEIQKKSDMKLGYERTEVRSKSGNSHLGHVFSDGPKDKGGLRYCINSASMEFVPLDKMKEKGYGNYMFEFASKQNWEIATLAGGCFWGVEELFRELPGVVETRVGYSGGNTDHATYAIVKLGTSQHAESVQILFDPKKISYEKILLHFFKIHDPTTKDQQGNDKGTQYRSAIFFNNAEQKKVAEVVMARVEKSKAWKLPLTTQVAPFSHFWVAEEEHQKYLKKNPKGYTCHFERKISF